MGMDLLRSCYKTQMSFFNDDPTPCDVTWFFCQEGAPPFPYYHRFASANWNSDKDPYLGLGEVYGAPRIYSKLPIPVELDGNHFCGPLEVYTDGQPIADPHLCTDPNGVSSCCLVPREWWCCDFAQIKGITRLPVQIIITQRPDPIWQPFFPFPGYPTVLTGLDPTGLPSSLFIPFFFGPIWHPIYVGIAAVCFGHYWSTAFGGSGQWTVDPLGIRLEHVRPFELIGGPPADYEITIILGDNPPNPPPPDTLVFFPPGYWPKDYWPRDYW